MAELTVITWRDLPAQVVAKAGRVTAKAVLSERFQEAIDMAATRAGRTGSDEYLAEWRRTTRPCGDDLEAEAQAEADRLESMFPPEALDRIVRAGGLDEDKG
jgi:hypothetical protein